VFSADLSTRPGDGYVVVELRGELDVADAVAVAATIAAVAVREPEIHASVAEAARARLAEAPGGSVSTYRLTGDVAGMPVQAVPPADQTDRSRR
jgi:hypothetical protein